MSLTAIAVQAKVNDYVSLCPPGGHKQLVSESVFSPLRGEVTQVRGHHDELASPKSPVQHSIVGKVVHSEDQILRLLPQARRHAHKGTHPTPPSGHPP